MFATSGQSGIFSNEIKMLNNVNMKNVNIGLKKTLLLKLHIILFPAVANQSCISLT